MWHRALPIAILLGALGGVAAWLRTPMAAPHHGRRVFELAIRHRERMGSAWPEPDAKQLWTSVLWFGREAPEGLRWRILEGIQDKDAVRREAAAVLASELSYYRDYPGLMAYYSPSYFPSPRGAERGTELAVFRTHDLVSAHPDVFATLGKDAGERTRRCLLNLGDPDLSKGMRRAFENIAERDPVDDLRTEALSALADAKPDPGSLQVLRRLQGDPKPRLRWAALAGLAHQSDAEGSRAFVAALCLPPAGLNSRDLEMQCAMMRRPFPSLRDAIGPVVEFFHEGWSPGAGLPCDLWAPWEAWLQQRESEGFAAEPQRTRDQTFEDLQRLDTP